MRGVLARPLRPEGVIAMLEEPRRLATGRPGAGPIGSIALDARQASYVFQSKHALRSGSVVGYQTLLRLPGVDTIDRWFAGLDHSSAFAMTIAAARAAFSLSGRLGHGRETSPVAFHCPAEIFSDARFLAELTRISAAARENGHGGRVAIELTAPTDAATLSDILSIAFRYVLAGFELHMNDFAMSAFSLEQVVRLPINEAKIDRHFFETLAKDEPQLLAEIISLFRLRGVRSTVARIEAPEEFEAARQAGADSGQGYFWSRPMTDIRL
ncbi:MAG: EAL domain-containing protein [Sphingobium sp.]|nr:EAL domain-containing protein [Sphingobium sp.]